MAEKSKNKPLLNNLLFFYIRYFCKKSSIYFACLSACYCDTMDLTLHSTLLLAVPDTWGRLPVGFFWGHLISMGQYEECVAASNTYGTEIRGQYCLARLNITQFYSRVKRRHEETARISYKQTDPQIFELGVCVPSTCSAAETDKHLKYAIERFYGKDVVGLDQQLVHEKWCKYDAPIEFRGIDIFAMYVQYYNNFKKKNLSTLLMQPNTCLSQLQIGPVCII